MISIPAETHHVVSPIDLTACPITRWNGPEAALISIATHGNGISHGRDTPWCAVVFARTVIRNTSQFGRFEAVCSGALRTVLRKVVATSPLSCLPINIQSHFHAHARWNFSIITPSELTVAPTGSESSSLRTWTLPSLVSQSLTILLYIRLRRLS
jgi:hypothetical protein